jgi:hypothetical protein
LQNLGVRTPHHYLMHELNASTGWIRASVAVQASGWQFRCDQRWLRRIRAPGRTPGLRTVRAIRSAPVLAPQYKQRRTLVSAAHTQLGCCSVAGITPRLLNYWSNESTQAFGMELEYIPSLDVSFRPAHQEHLRGYMRALLKALACMHQLGLVHRDIKRANVLVRLTPNDGLLSSRSYCAYVLTVRSYTRTRGGGEAHRLPVRVSPAGTHRRRARVHRWLPLSRGS